MHFLQNEQRGLQQLLLSHHLPPEIWLEYFNQQDVYSSTNLDKHSGSVVFYSSLLQYVNTTEEETALKKLIGITEEMLDNKESACLDSSSNLTPTDALQHYNCVDQFSEYLEVLGLTKKFPNELKLRDAMILRMEMLSGMKRTSDLKQLPYLLLQKIFMCDSRSRATLFSGKITNNSILGDLEKIHPIDSLIVLLHCCDNFLRQELFSKLAICQMAVPMLLPNPHNGGVIFLVWALRSIIKSWNSHITKGEPVSKECRITDYNAPVISFLKIGEHQYSKSAIINNIFSDSKQDIFFHWNCEGGTAKRFFVDGLVEISCFLPPKDDDNDDFYPDMLIFTNLHGDARQSAKQTNFIKELSFMSFVLLTEECIDDTVIDLLSKLSDSPGGVVLVLPELKKSQPLRKKATKDLQKSMRILKIKKENDPQIKSEIRQAISDSLNPSLVKQCKALGDCIEIARTYDIDVDEDDEGCSEGRIHAESVIDKIRSVDITKAKFEMLPLQGSDLWHEWTKLDKESYRQHYREGTTIKRYNKNMEMQKKNIRKKQTDASTQPTPVMKSFLDILLKETDPGSKRIYFLYWLKMMLDDYSMQKLPHLNAAYQNTRQQLSKLLEDNKNIQEDSDIVMSLKVELKKQNDELVNASFGLEHLFREMGQMYEARMDGSSSGFKVDRSIKKVINSYPQLVVELMENGFPIELMDGDTSHVPKTWILAIIQKLKNRCGETSKIFVISALGIQSTGKSTLLNTVFGLHFSVSAGRCTRGAYFQLLLLDDALREQTKCDFILIVDTEGLRAPELLYKETQKHDNELATFVIGLSDLTVINIFGLVPGELTSILETVVFALIRMKEVDLQLSCYFVHQNVSDLMANDKGQFGRQQIQDELDKMTRAIATTQQSKSKYRSFQDVIYFDSDSDVALFPGLWKGDPPMAPVNPGYSDAACKLKQALFKLVTKKKNYCTFVDFELRVSKLWEAVLRENYAFSFKNTLEVIAYNELDTKYANWSWKLKKQKLKWQNKSGHEINGCDFQKIDTVIASCLKKLEKELNAVYLTVTADMKNFFEKSERSITLAQWRKFTEIRLSRLLEEHKIGAKKHCNVLKVNREGKFKFGIIRQQYREQMHQSITKLILETQKEEVSSQELENRFDIHWQQWFQDLSQSERLHLYPTNDEIELSITYTLTSIFQAQEPWIIQKLDFLPLTRRGTNLKLDILPDVHLDSNKWYRRFKAATRNIMKQQSRQYTNVTEEDIHIAKLKTEEYLNKSKENIESSLNTLLDYSEEAVFDVIMELSEAIDEFNKGKNDFSFKPEYGVDMAIAVAGYAYIKLTNMVKKLQIENDPIQSLTRLKPVFFRTFELQCSAASNDKTAADNLCTLLTLPIQNALKDSLRIEIVEDMKKSSLHFGKKNYFKVKILESLALDVIEKLEKARNNHDENKIKKKYFDLYTVFLNNISESFKYWSEVYTKQHCGTFKEGESKLTELARLHLNTIIHNITEIINDLETLYDAELEESLQETDSNVESMSVDCENDDEVDNHDPTASIDINAWLESFQDRIQKVITVDMEEMQQMVGVAALQDVKLFTKQFIRNLSREKKSIMEAFQDLESDIAKVTEWDQPPHLVLYDTLIGCKDQCPFCKEQCEYTDGNHEGKCHFSEIHRPQCLGRYIWLYNWKMVLNTCTASIESKDTFQNSDTEYKPHPFKEFQKIYPTWVISNESPKAGPKYWQWFCATFNTQIIDWIGCIPTSVQDLGWHDITGKDAIDSLYEAYRIKVD